MFDAWYIIACKITLWVVSILLILPGMTLFFLKSAANQEVVNRIHSTLLTDYQRKADISKNFIDYLSLLAETIRHHGKKGYVLISQTGQKTSFVVTHKKPSVEQEEELYSFFHGNLGKERVDRLLRLFEKTDGFTCAKVANILTFTGFVHIDDMKQMHEELRLREKTYYLTQSEIEEYRTSSDVPFQLLDQEQMNRLWNLMILKPLPLSTRFVFAPCLSINPDQRRGWRKSAMKNALLYEYLRMKQRTQDSSLYEYTLIKTSLGIFYPNQRSSIQGKVLQLRKGYGVIGEMLTDSDGRCNIIPLHSLHNPKSWRLYFLPTQVRAPANIRASLSGVIERCPGESGARAIYEKVKEFLIEKGADCRVKWIGYSQGGAQAAALYPLFFEKIRKLVVVNAPFVTKRVSELFRDFVMRHPPEHPLKIDTIWQEQDSVHWAGEEDIGYRILKDPKARKHLQQRIIYFSDKQEQQVNKPYAPCCLAAFFQALWAVWKTHSQDKTIFMKVPPTILDSSDNATVEKMCSLMKNLPWGWEKVRQKFMWGGFWKSHFPEFLQEEKKKFERILV